METNATVSEVVEIVFSQPPKETCFYQLYFPEKDLVTIFPFLIKILVGGAKMLYGNEILPHTMTMEQFEILKKYMLSMGFAVKYNYIYAEEIPIIMNLWFESLGQFTDCHGHTIIKKIQT